MRAVRMRSALTTVSMVGALGVMGTGTAAQSFTIEDVLSPGYPIELVSARSVDRIAWIEYEEGRRNVYTAEAPAFEPVRLTAFMGDDGRDLSNLRISDDGETVVFIRGHTPNRSGWIANPGSDPGGSERAVWAVSTRGGEPWRVAEAWNVALSPDGEWIAWDRNGAIYLAPVNPGTGRGASGDEVEPLFSVFGEQQDPVWSPDSRKLAFVSDRDDHSFIGIYDLREPGIVYLAPGVDRDESPTWSPDGTRVAFIRRPGLPFGAAADRGGREDQDWPEGLTESRFEGGYDFSIWVADTETGAGSEVWHNAPGDEVHEDVESVMWAGERVIFQAEPDGWRHYYSVDPDQPGSDAVLLTPGDGIAEHVSLSADGRTLFYATNAGDIDRRHLWRVPTSGGEAVQLTGGEDIETYPAALAGGDEVALLSAGYDQPQTVAVVAASGGTPRLVRSVPDRFPADRHVVPRAVTLEAEDGFEFYNQLFLPPDLEPGERRPALIFIHGGSRRQMLLGYHYMHFYHMAYALNQYWANQGYVVLSVNYRSGIGYGRAFRNAPGRGREGNTEYRDIRAAGMYLREREDVDAERIGLWGLSYGGILTAQGLARDSDLFAAGVDMAGVHLWGNTIDPEAVSYRSSSISEIEEWTSPVLLIHGDDDRNVDFSQTVGLVQLLRAHQVPHELIVFPDEVHDFLLHERWLTSFRASDRFLERHLKGGGDAVTMPR